MAERFRVHIARDQMLKAAADYERMANDAEQREIAQGLSYLRALAAARHLPPLKLRGTHPYEFSSEHGDKPPLRAQP